ncbi:MAG TPA: hypothetical protein VFF06_04725 [Polyangia bacterium]|nr:hypothetical protein [Polyangia bacterium]
MSLLARIEVIAAVSLVACGTIDPGPDTMPPAGCEAPAPFFVSDVWPKYFDTYMCGKSDCHDSSSGHGYFRLQSVAGVPAPQPTDSVAIWPTAWQNNLLAIQHNVSCTNPTQSLVLTVPSGESQPHPPGVIVLDIPAATTLFTTWLQ